MDWFQVIVLAIVQGLTEFLPVSSSAHLILVPQLLHWPDQGITFDIAVHVGTLIAVLAYFRHRWIPVFTGRGSPHNKLNRRLLLSVVVATIPVGLFGLFGKSYVITLRSTVVIAWATIGFGLLLGLADYLGSRKRSLSHIRMGDAFLIGLGQALSLIPGTSRSGITLTMGLMRGFDRRSAAEYSFLLSIPVIILAGGLEFFGLVNHNHAVEWSVLGVGMVVSSITGYLCIDLFLRWIDRMGMTPFVIYRFCLGLTLLYFST